MRNVVVAQSGGPSPVINASLQGVVEGCAAFPGRFGAIYAGWHGIEGVLREELLDLSAQPREEIARRGERRLQTARRARSGFCPDH